MKAIIAGGCAALLLPVVLLAAVTGAVGAVSPGAATNLGIPLNMAELYVEAGRAIGVPAPIVAGIGKVECDHNRNPACQHPNFAGAAGPMQFLPPTFDAYKSASGSAAPSIYNERDAVFAAAAMLKANGVNRDERAAIFSYNHSNAYVDDVLGWADKYAALGQMTIVVETARSYLGVPYAWGGTSRGGIDCSGLVLRSFEAVGLKMPRVAQDQSNIGNLVANVQDVRAGDLLSYGSSTSSVTHIAIATDSTHMIEAPRAGVNVREVPIRTDDLVVIRRAL